MHGFEKSELFRYFIRIAKIYDSSNFYEKKNDIFNANKFKILSEFIYQLLGFGIFQKFVVWFPKKVNYFDSLSELSKITFYKIFTYLKRNFFSFRNF